MWILFQSRLVEYGCVKSLAPLHRKSFAGVGPRIHLRFDGPRAVPPPCFKSSGGENFVTGDNGHLAGENLQVIVPSGVRLRTACVDQLRSPQGVMILL